MKASVEHFKNIEATVRHALLLALVYLLLAAQALSPIQDPDIWWHLRTGQWIVENGTVPHVDYFSTFGLGKHWVAYSWLFEVLVYRLFQAMGLLGLIFFTAFLGLCSAAAIHLLVRHARLPLVQEIVLTATVLICLKPLMNPRAWWFSILFFTLELTILVRFRASRNERLLWFLPALFILWANFHIQFVYGLAVLALFAFEPVVQSRLARFRVPAKPSDADLPLGKASLLLASCLLATLINPYHFNVYKPVFEVIQDTRAYDMISELLALSFRFLDNWFVLALLVSVTFYLGWRREQRLFPLGLMTIGLFLSFRSRRDVWMGALAAVAVIVDWPRSRTLQATHTRGSIVLAAILIALGIAYFAHSRSISTAGLSSQLAKRYPTDAVRFIETNHPPGTIFNHYDWGGFLMWSLPRFLVAMDGRSNLHGEERVGKNIDIWLGRPAWDKDPELAEARLVVGPVNLPLVTLLRTDSRFQLCYEDKIAAVFVAVRHAQSGKCQKT